MIPTVPRTGTGPPLSVLPGTNDRGAARALRWFAEELRRVVCDQAWFIAVVLAYLGLGAAFAFAFGQDVA